MVGACKQVFVQPCRDRVWSAVGDHGVNQAVAARPGDFVVGEAQPFPVVAVVSQVEVHIERLASHRTGPCRVGGQHHLVFGRQERRRTNQLTGPCRVFGCGQVRVRPGAAACGQAQDPGAQCGHHPAVGGHPIVVEPV